MSKHEKALEKQDREFERNAHIRQKIYAGIFTALILGVWAWLIDYDPIHVWYGILVVPYALFGVWLMLTKKNYPWEMKGENND